MTKSAKHARRGVVAVGIATDALLTAIDKLDDGAVRAPSRLPGWSRGHVITHLARNADGLVNLLTWARTGVEHPMYTSRADRDAAIEKGSTRPYRLLAEDLAAACERFAAAADAMPESAWSARVLSSAGKPLPAARVPWLRVREVWVHLVDLDAGTDFDAIPAEIVEELLDDAVRQYIGRDDVPALTLHAELPNGLRRTWVLEGFGEDAEVTGDSVALLAWLTGRGSGAGLSGTPPRLPPWI
jgi:maleylpyruvate isomerase